MRSQRRDPSGRPWIIFTAVVVGLGLATVFTVLALSLRSHASDEITASTQESWGRYLLELYAPDRESPRASCVLELQAIADSLSQIAAAEPVHISVSRAPAINAVSLPGRRIVLYQGLLDDAESENELTMILAHELAHHEGNDILEAFGRNTALSIASAGFGTVPVLGVILAEVGRLGELSFSREAERAADQLALDWLDAYYGHAGGATDFFERHDPDDDWAEDLEFLSTHPLYMNRVEALEMQIRNAGYARGAVAASPDVCAE